jgi:phosphate acyltransferase
LNSIAENNNDEKTIASAPDVRDSSSGVVRIALDVMGSDHGPEKIISGAVIAARELGDDVELTLVGDSEEIEKSLRGVEKRPGNISCVHAPNSILMSDSPSEAVRKPNTSVALGLELQSEGRVDAFVSAGNTGAIMAGSLLKLRRIPGVNRPAICALFPTRNFKTTLALDVGANSECKPLNLVQFGALGSAYVSAMYNIKRPKVGLLSIGHERVKGNTLIAESHKLMENSNLNFIGNVEGKDILSGDVDVVVTDGFTGNVILKFGESIESFLTDRIRHQVSTNVFSRVGAALMSPFLGRLRRAFDYAEAGGAPLLGIEGITIVCHGASSPRAIKNGLSLAVRMVRTDTLENTRQRMRDSDLLKTE